jgi:hypothetical protein
MARNLFLHNALSVLTKADKGYIGSSISSNRVGVLTGGAPLGPKASGQFANVISPPRASYTKLDR